MTPTREPHGFGVVGGRNVVPLLLQRLLQQRQRGDNVAVAAGGMPANRLIWGRTGT